MKTLTIPPWECINALLNHIPAEPGLLASLPSLSTSVLQCFSDRWYIHRRCLSGISVSAPTFSVLQWRWVISASVTQCQCFQCFSAPVTLSHQCFSDSVSVLSVFQCFSGAGVIGVHWASVSVTKVSVLSVFTLTPHIPNDATCKMFSSIVLD